MFYHSCGNPLYADISNNILCLVSFTITRDGIRPSHAEFVVKNTDNKIEFYCSNCNGKVEEDEIKVICMNCGHLKPLNNNKDRIFIPHHSGGTYCEECCNEIFPEESKTDVAVAIKKIRF